MFTIGSKVVITDIPSNLASDRRLYLGLEATIANKINNDLFTLDTNTDPYTSWPAETLKLLSTTINNIKLEEILKATIVTLPDGTQIYHPNNSNQQPFQIKPKGIL